MGLNIRTLTMAGTAAIVLSAAPVAAQHDHAAMGAMHDTAMATLPTQAGQAAFGTIQEIVRILEADPTTDWSRVNLEALRQHLIDMDDVTLRAQVAQRNIDGGFVADVTGTGRTVGAIQRMLVAHADMMNMGAAYHVTAVKTASGARMTVTAANAGDAREVAMLRGLGVIGVLTDGDHHPRHHLALARGESMGHGM